MPEDPASPLNTDTDTKEIRRKSVRGGKITLITRIANIGLQMASTVTVARLLGPEEYGIIAMVTAITSFAGLFRDLGLSSATIQRDKLSQEQLSTLYWINVAAGGILTLIVSTGAPLVSLFYGRPELTWVTLALSARFFINGFSTQQSALLIRQMKFGRHAVATLSGGLSNLIIAIAFAYYGFGYWALVLSSIGSGIITACAFNFGSPWKPGPPRRRTGVRSMLRYGANITLFEIINFFSRNLDNILIGRFIGADALGIYNRAYQLMLFPINNLRNPISAAVFPALSRLQHDPATFSSYYKQCIFVVSFVGMPLMTFLFLANESVVLILLGNDWAAVAPVFQILSIVGFIQPSLAMIGLALLSTGQANLQLKLGILNSTVTIIGFAVGLQWGILGIATAYCATNYLLIHPNLAIAFRSSESGLTPRSYYSTIAPTVCLCLASAILTHLVVNLASIKGHAPWVQIAGYSLCFFPTLTLLNLALTRFSRSHRRFVASVPLFSKFSFLR